MSYQVLARKWRPQTFNDLVGQEHVVQALVNGLDQDRVHHAFLLTGTRGVGKTTIARILAKCLNCETGVSSTPCGECGSCVDVDTGRFVDMLEIDAASKTKVDDTRELLETVQYTPTRGRYKVYIIDEVHMLSGHSFNALLKTLEEPPPHVKFVLATTDPQKLPVTILSRCLRFSLTRLMPTQIADRLAMILEAESVTAEQSAILRIARAADGSMRDGLSLLDQAIAFGGGSLEDSDVASMLGSIDHLHIRTIIDALVAGNAGALLSVVNDLSLQSRNLESVLDELAEAMHRIVLIQAAPDFRDPEREDWDSLVASSQFVSAEDAQLYYQIAISGRRDLAIAPDPRTGLEMTLLRMLTFKPADAQDTAGGGSTSATHTSQSSADTKHGNRAMPGTGQARNRDSSEAAREARKAFDAMTESAEGGQTETVSEPETRSLPEIPPPATVEVQLDWSSLQTRLDVSGAARELARNLQLESAEDHRWKFLVPETLRHLGTGSAIRDLQSALARCIGRTVKLELQAAREPLKTVAAATKQANTLRQSEAEKLIGEDPTVNEIKDTFDARVVPDSIQPLQ